MVEVSLTVGKLDASLALLLTKDHHLIEFPTILLPNGVKAGSIVKIKCDQDFETEKEETRQFNAIQDEILSTFGTNLPQNPVLSTINVTQTSCVLEWQPLDLGTASLKNLFLFKDGKKLGTIPQPLTNRTTKLSGLPIDKTFNFQLRLDTTAGVYSSDVIEVTTHKMTDLSGITACLGDITANDQFTVDEIHQTLKAMGAHFPAQDKVKVDTTHFICTRENKSNPEYVKATDMNIPIIRPEWLKACERDRRIVGVRDYYVKDCVLPDIFAKNFWKSKPAASKEPVQESNGTVPEAPSHEINLDKQVPELPQEKVPEKELPVPEIVVPAEAEAAAETAEVAEVTEAAEPVEEPEVPVVTIEAPVEAPVEEPKEVETAEEPVVAEPVEAAVEAAEPKAEPIEAEPVAVKAEAEPVKATEEPEPAQPEPEAEAQELDEVDLDAEDAGDDAADDGEAAEETENAPDTSDKPKKKKNKKKKNKK